MDELKIGAGEVPVVGDVLDGFEQFEGDFAAASAAGREALTGKNDDVVVSPMVPVIDTVQARRRRSVAGTMKQLSLAS